MITSTRSLFFGGVGVLGFVWHCGSTCSALAEANFSRSRRSRSSSTKGDAIVDMLTLTMLERKPNVWPLRPNSVADAGSLELDYASGKESYCFEELVVGH